MIKRMLKRISKGGDYSDPEVREKIGSFSGIMGIVLNVLISAAKIVVGAIIGAISIISDGINNISDAGSSVITLLGFKLSSKKPDKEHPYGHGRIEYFAGLAVGIVIIVVAVQLFMDSLSRIIGGETVSYDSDVLFAVTVIILSLSILVKLWMAVFNRVAGNLISSVAMKATSADSISDCVSTSVVLISAVLSRVISSVPVDGIAGLMVSLFIAYTGIRSVKEVADVLLGHAPDAELVKKVEEFTLGFDEKVVGIHDLMYHDYGPGRKYLVLHVEVPSDGDIMELHDMIDNIETELTERFGCISTIHMDPVVTNNERVDELKNLVIKAVKEIDPGFSIHDFRMNEGQSHANLLFDVVITHETKLSPDEIKAEISEKIRAHDPKLAAVMKIEYPLV